MPTISEIRPPYIVRTNKSRPLGSVPNQCSDDGGARMEVQKISSIGCGQNIGTNTDRKAMITKITRLATAARFRRKRPQALAHKLRPSVSSGWPGVNAPRSTTPTASKSDPVLVITNLGIQIRVQQVDDQIERHDQAAVKDHHAHHKGIIAVQGALNEVTPDARNSKNLLDDH